METDVWFYLVKLNIFLLKRHTVFNGALFNGGAAHSLPTLLLRSQQHPTANSGSVLGCSDFAWDPWTGILMKWAVSMLRCCSLTQNFHIKCIARLFSSPEVSGCPRLLFEDLNAAVSPRHYFWALIHLPVPGKAQEQLPVLLKIPAFNEFLQQSFLSLLSRLKKKNQTEINYSNN